MRKLYASIKRTRAAICACLCLCAIFVTPAFAQKTQAMAPELAAKNPVEVFPVVSGSAYVFNDSKTATQPSVFSVNEQDHPFPVFSTEVFAATSSHYQVQSVWKTAAPIQKGEVLLARFSIRSIYAKQESGDAVVYFFVQQALPPHDKSVIIEISAGPEWKTIEIPFKALNDLPAGEASMCFSYGALAQKVEVADIQVLNFGQKIALEQLPTTRFSYAGREENAAWRVQALQRIEEIRTAPLVIKVLDKKGKPVSGAAVTARLIDPEFVFGTAVSVSYLLASDANGTTYKNILNEYFNAVTLDNNLKWPVWRDPEKQQQTKIALDYLEAQNLRIRGHNLVWPGKKFTPAYFANQPDFGPAFGDSITRHIQDIASYTKGKVYAWDVINEMMHEKDYFDVLPQSEAVEWFKLAKDIDPDAQLFINDYSMLNNVASPINIATYLSVIASLRGAGAPIEAIGVQGHVGRQPRNPKQVLQDLDLFVESGLPVQITEFDINSPDENLQADYTRDFLIACYSHPVVTGFTMWGFWEGAHWKPDAAMFRRDWTPKPNSEVWRKWVLQEWRTDIQATSNAAGELAARGHLGLYEITVTHKGATQQVNYQLTQEAAPLVLQLK